MLSADGISLAYDRRGNTVVHGVSLSVTPGSVTGILGPNGCGKSTVIKALSRVLKPLSGSVTVDGRDLYSAITAGESARTIAVVPQSTSIPFDFSVRDIVAMGRTPYLGRNPFAADSAESRERIQRSLEQMHVEHVAERVANTLSGGELQRVLFARALAQDTPVLLLDEPTAHLDMEHQHAILQMAQSRARAQGTAVLTVLHDPNLAAAYCDTLILMEGGRIVASGAPKDVLVPDLFEQVFHQRIWVRSHPALGHPVVMRLPDAPTAHDLGEALDAPRVHVICGGGSGSQLLSLLWQQGCRVSAGPLNTGDTDLEVCSLLGIPAATVPPFTAAGTAQIADAAHSAAAADWVIVSEVPVGPANLPILESLRALPSMHNVLLAGSAQTAAARDHVDGRYGALCAELEHAGARWLSDTTECLQLLSRRQAGERNCALTSEPGKQVQ